MHNYRFPFYPPLPFRRRNYNYYNLQNSNDFSNIHNTVTSNNINNSSNVQSNNSLLFNEPPSDTRYETNNDTVIFEFLGLKIYFDDILILLILLFLYEEKIQDEYLFIALILLLLN